MWKTSPTELSRSYHRLADRFPGRFVLGVGVGHAEQVGEMYERPYESLMRYLDVLDGCGVPASDRVIAALGDRMLRVSAERSLGAHTYLVPSKHTLHARHLVGIDAEIAPCTKVVFGDSIEVATEEAAKAIADPYLGLVNYRNSLLRLGYSGEEIQHPRSIVADLVAMPTPGAVVARANEHGAAGASHVSLQLVGSAARHLTESLGLLADAFVTRRLFREP